MKVSHPHDAVEPHLLLWLVAAFVILASLCVLRHVPLMTEATAANIWEALGG